MPVSRNGSSVKALAAQPGDASPCRELERRFQLSHNHTISKHILDTHPHCLIGLEDLSGIRERTKRRKKRRKGNHLVPASPKARKANRHASRWAFAALRGLLTYKASLMGSRCISVDADYTSQCCPRCGHTSRQNRPHHGLLIVCQHCGFSLHADLVGSRNICLRALVIRQDWMATGKPVRCPRCDRLRSQSGTPAPVCRIAVESGHKPPALAGGT